VQASLPTTSDSIPLRSARIGDVSTYASEADYQYAVADSPSFWDSVKEGFLAWLERNLGLRPSSWSHEQWQYIQLAMAVLLLTLLGFWAARKLRRSRGWRWWLSNPAWSEQPLTGGVETPAMSWQHAHDEAVASGNYREAVRCLYWALLTNMHHHQLIELDHNKTNADYWRELRLAEGKPLFAQINRHFAYVWYGHHQAHAAAHQQMRTLCQQFTQQWLRHD